MKIDMPGYGSETSPYDEFEWCSCSKTRRLIGSKNLCKWCEVDDYTDMSIDMRMHVELDNKGEQNE